MQLASASVNDIVVWDMATDEIVSTLEFRLGRERSMSGESIVAWSPTGTLLAVAGHGGVEVWDTATG